MRLIRIQENLTLLRPRDLEVLALEAEEIVREWRANVGETGDLTPISFRLRIGNGKHAVRVARTAGSADMRDRTLFIHPVAKLADPLHVLAGVLPGDVSALLGAHFIEGLRPGLLTPKRTYTDSWANPDSYSGRMSKGGKIIVIAQLMRLPIEATSGVPVADKREARRAELQRLLGEHERLRQYSLTKIRDHIERVRDSERSIEKIREQLERP